ncbi:MAG: cbb3-type cytochrome c oxidase subunit I [Rickettsiales bacterium]
MNATSKPLSRYWLFAGVIALAIAGLFSVVLVMARSPQFANLLPLNDVFHTALVVHVDLSILVWFLAIAGLIWARAAEQMPNPVLQLPYFRAGGVAAFSVGIAAIAFAPLDTNGQPLMSNYIPVLTTPVFFIGLALVAAGLILSAIDFLAVCGVLPMRQTVAEESTFDKAMRFGAWTAALMLMIALAYFDMSANALKGQPKDTEFYEHAFWAGGHILQFLYTQLLVFAWVLLLNRIYGIALYARIITVLFFLGILPVLISIRIMTHMDLNDAMFFQEFTDLMIKQNGTAPGLALIFLLFVGFRHRREQAKTALNAYLGCSVALFVYGGVLGLLISGQNVTIPAHYHGSIVGVTLAMMGLTVALLPEYGYRDASRWKLAYWQPVTLAVGQIMHVTGLAWSGGYGVLRKTPGALEGGAKAAMGLMGMGGLLAIIGGLMFVIVVWKSIRPPKVLGV